jgi:transcriptional regulator with XRE-family HTH domain
MGAKTDPVGVQFGRNLRRLRSLAGISQAELGRRLGVSFQQVQKYESGANNVNVNVPTLCRLQAILGCAFADLLAGLGGEGDAAGGDAAEESGRQHQLAFGLMRAMRTCRSG